MPEATIYVNWNNMAAHWYFPKANGTGQLNHDWFVHARVRGGTQLWTEDWFGDGLSWQWSYYAALMSSATRLAVPFEGTREFGGYVVPRSSGGHVEGALLRRVISLVGGGSKGMTYFTFGPEYNVSSTQAIILGSIKRNGLVQSSAGVCFERLSVIAVPRELLQ